LHLDCPGWRLDADNINFKGNSIHQMKYSLVSVFLFYASFTFAQGELNIFTERQGDQVTVYADNPAIIPMTVDLKMELTNMKTDFGGKEGTFVIPPGSGKYKITTAKAIRKSGRTGLDLDSFVYTGDINKKPDVHYLYELPFETAKRYRVSQGYNGKFSHRGVNAIDFSLDVGEKVFAARGGIVYKVEDRHSKACNHSSCQEYNNFITVYHSDGTFSEYSHLKQHGVQVNAGQEIQAGDFIGYSGNTGWSSGPHLHFVVYKYNKRGQRETLKTRFKTSEGDVFLQENESYTRS
jgi:hypothetical protein